MIDTKIKKVMLISTLIDALKKKQTSNQPLINAKIKKVVSISVLIDALKKKQ